MQFPEDTALANALKPGQTQEVSFTLMFDWQRDGNFATEYADMSDNIVEVTLDAQFTGNYPAATEINDGYAQRRLTAVVQGPVSGVDVVKLFSPFSGSYLGSIGAVNTPCWFSVTYMTENGPREIRQFTGYVLTAKPSRKDGTVEIEMADITSQLSNGISYQPFGRSWALATWNLNVLSDGTSDTVRNEAMRIRGGQSLSWYMIDVLRKSGLYQGPPAPAESVFYTTLHGGNLPEIGNFYQMPNDGRQDRNALDGVGLQLTWDQPIYADNLDPSNSNYPTSSLATDIDTSYNYPIYTWERGRFGPRMKRSIYDPAKTRVSVETGYKAGIVDLMQGTYTSSYPIIMAPTTSQVARVGGGGYYEFDSTEYWDNTTRIEAFMGGLTNQTDSGGTQYGTFTIQVFPADNQYFDNACTRLSIGLVSPTASGSWDYYANAIPDGNHYIGWNAEFRIGAPPKVSFKIDDAVYSDVTPAYSSGNIPSDIAINRYVNPYAEGFTLADNKYIESSLITLATTGGAEHWGIWCQQAGSPNRPLVWSDEASQPFTKSTDIGPSMARVMWHPAIRNKAAWDLLKEIGSSDLGVIYTDEFGMIRYNNWSEIKLKQADPANFQLSLDDVQDLDPFTTFDSVINQVSYQFKDRAFADTCIYAAQDVDQFATRSYTQAKYTVSAEDVVGMLQGKVSWRPVAQGYPYPDPEEIGGDTWGYPGATEFYRSDWAKAYNPEVWKNGFTVHNMGDLWDPSGTSGSTAGGVPVPLLGVSVNIIAYLGWWPYDEDTSHITIVVRNDNNKGGRTTRVSVDDQTPFLKLRGWQLQDLNSGSETVNNTESQAIFGVRLLERPATDWTTDYSTQYDLSKLLVDDLSTPRPVFETLDLQGDPRRQLQDIIQIVDTPNSVLGGSFDESDGAFGGPIVASVVGINRKFSTSDGVSETLTLRTIENRGGAWILGDPNLSQLGVTTILSTGE